jgi:hypothetical protein
MNDRDEILRELNQIYTKTSSTPEERLMTAIRIKELQRALLPSGSSVRCDLNLGSLAETPPEIDRDDEGWKGDPMLRHMHETGENWE